MNILLCWTEPSKVVNRFMKSSMYSIISYTLLYMELSLPSHYCSSKKKKIMSGIFISHIEQEPTNLNNSINPVQLVLLGYGRFC